MSLFAVILTYNEAQHIGDCIETVQFADHIIVFDSFSTDATVQMAEKAGVEVIQHHFRDYASQRNTALKAAEGRADWVLFVDADERVTSELAREVRSAIQDSKCPGYRIPRHNYIFGKLTLGAGWYPDYQTRLLRVGAARYDPSREVHELVLLEGELGTLSQHFVHLNYHDLDQFKAKQNRYVAYDASIMFQQGVRPKPQNYVLQPWRQFWWRFITLKGYCEGLHGLRLSVYMAWYEWRKYIALRQLWLQKKSGRPEVVP